MNLSSKNTEWVVGWHPVFAALEARPQAVVQVLLEKGRTDGRAKELQKKAEELGFAINRVDRTHLDKLITTGQHQGVALETVAKPSLTEDQLLAQLKERSDPLLLLILEEVQDPHNLGACWRSAEAFGVDAFITTTRHTAEETVVVKKIAAGAAETLPLVPVKNLVRFLTELKKVGVWVVGTAQEASENIQSFNFPKRCALVMGKEGEGLRHLTRETCDYLISIPLQGKVRSLNLSVATGICLFQAKNYS